MTSTPTAAASVAFMLGHPVAHTAMPAGVNAWARETGTDAMMAPLDLPPEALAGFLQALRGMANCPGCVLTAPHKQAALTLVDRASAAAEAAGGVNVITRTATGELVGDNTDGAGFVAALEAADGVPRNVLIFGCGGAGASIATAIAARAPVRLDLVEADPARSAALAARLGAPAQAIAAPASLEDYDLIVNATAVGLGGEGMIHDLDGLRPGAVVADVVTKPAVTPFLKAAEAKGARIQPGAAMALAQIPLVRQAFGWGE